MVGGYGRREDGVAPAINTSNIFAALESRKRGKGKKKAAELKKDTPKKDSSSKLVPPESSPSPAALWAAPQVSVSGCWADAVDDDDSDGGLGPLPDWATPNQDTEPPASVGTNEGEGEGGVKEEEEVHGVEEDSDGDDDDHEDEADDDGEEDGEEDSSALSGRSPPTLSHSRSLSIPSIIQATPPERQLSKKELKKKEMQELEAVLMEFGIADVSSKGENGKADDNAGKGSSRKEDKDVYEGNEDVSTGGTGESKKKKKKKKTGEKLAGGGPEQEVSSPAGEQVEETLQETPNSVTDKKDVLKRLASLKKSKSKKEKDEVAAKAKLAAAEAAARSAKMSKKKDKTHYNQQPVR